MPNLIRLPIILNKTKLEIVAGIKGEIWLESIISFVV